MRKEAVAAPLTCCCHQPHLTAPRHHHSGQVEFRDVQFAYPMRPDIQVLKYVCV